MRKFGIKIISKFIKNPKKREFIYNFLSDWHFAESVMEREVEQDDCIKKLLFYAHNHLKRKNCVVVWIVGGLGNQMYLYAFGKALMRRGYSVVFDCGTYRYKNLYKTQIGGGDLYKIAESSNNFAESRLDSAKFTDSAPYTKKANSSIVDEFSQLCDASDKDRTDGSSRKRALCNCEKSPQDEFALDSANQNKICHTHIRNLDILNFNLTSPLDLDFDREIFFDLNDANRAFLPLNKKLNTPYKHLITGIEFQTQNLDFIPQGAYFDGYWFSLQYFKDLNIEKEFSLKTPLSSANATLKERILNTPDSAFLHIRRGDYLEIENAINLCEGKYYEGAITHLKSHLTKPHIFLFSNDIAWCEREFLATLSDSCKESVEFEFVANNGEDSAVQEMELMRACKHAINANSTFSWWASYLMQNPRKIVLMPNRYHKDQAQITYKNDTVIFEGVVLCDSHTGAITL